MSVFEFRGKTLDCSSLAKGARQVLKKWFGNFDLTVGSRTGWRRKRFDSDLTGQFSQREAEVINYPNISVAHNSRFISCSHFICFSLGVHSGSRACLVWIMVS